MIGFSMSSNSVYISTVQTGCLKTEFDSTYPAHLNGIISQDELRDSINRINRVIGSNKIVKILGILFTIGIIGGVIFFIVGATTAANSKILGLSPLVLAGIIITLVGSILFSVGCMVVQFQRASKMRQAIAEESKKYSSRSTPCSWRLETTRHVFGGYGYGNHYNTQVTHRLVIDIGRPIVPGNGTHYSNQAANESVLFSGQQDNSAPPPYSGTYTEFCFQCRTPRHDLSARFCSSCGQLFNR